MMRATYSVFLVGMLLVASMMVPYDLASRSSSSPTTQTSRSPVITLPAVPPGKLTLEFPDRWLGTHQATLYEATVYLPQTLGVTPSMVELRLPSQRTVYPGAQWLNISVNAPSQSSETTFGFEYVSADDRRGVRSIPNNGSYSLRLEEAMNDWSPDPHSRWRLRVFSHGLGGMDATVKITIAREPGPLPSHVLVADRWLGQDHRVVYEHKDTLRQATLLRMRLPVPDDRGPASSVPLRTVPALELKELDVHLYYNSSTPTDFHYRPLLSWNSPRADGYGYDRANMPPTHEQRGQSGHFLWRIPVEAEMYDNPLGTRSRWQISIDWHGNTTGSPETYMDGDYHFQIVAHRHVEVPANATRES